MNLESNIAWIPFALRPKNYVICKVFFVAPANNAGLPIPAWFPSLSDITNTKDYVEQLIPSEGKRSLLNETKSISVQ